MGSGGHSSLRCAGLSLSRPLLLRSTGSRRAGSVIVAHGPSCSAACGIFPDQGSIPCPLHWQADSQPLRHQGSPRPSHFHFPLNLKSVQAQSMYPFLSFLLCFSYSFQNAVVISLFTSGELVLDVFVACLSALVAFACNVWVRDGEWLREEAAPVGPGVDGGGMSWGVLQ